jgi:hypothetical protein
MKVWSWSRRRNNYIYSKCEWYWHAKFLLQFHRRHYKSSKFLLQFHRRHYNSSFLFFTKCKACPACSWWVSPGCPPPTGSPCCSSRPSSSTLSVMTTKMDVWEPGRFVTWTFCNWTFGIWTFVTGHCVTGRFVGMVSLQFFFASKRKNPLFFASKRKKIPIFRLVSLLANMSGEPYLWVSKSIECQHWSTGTNPNIREPCTGVTLEKCSHAIVIATLTGSTITMKQSLW